MDPKSKLEITFTFLSILLIIVSIPLILNKIPPNLYYGFRLKKTLSNEEIWYKANKYGGKSLLAASLFTLIGCLILFLDKGRLFSDGASIFSFVLLMVPIQISILLTLRYIKKL